jgi:hypothetical protein
MIKVVRRSGGDCTCPEDNWERRIDGTCRSGYCVRFRCPDCGGALGEWGPIACPHKKGDMPRWVRYPEMEPIGRWDFDKNDFIPVHVAIKPSIAKRTRRRVN